MHVVLPTMFIHVHVLYRQLLNHLGASIHVYYTVCSFMCIYFSCAETGGITISPRPAPDDSPPKPGYPSLPFFGILPELRTENVSHMYCNAVSIAICEDSYILKIVFLKLLETAGMMCCPAQHFNQDTGHMLLTCLSWVLSPLP